MISSKTNRLAVTLGPTAATRCSRLAASSGQQLMTGANVSGSMRLSARTFVHAVRTDRLRTLCPDGAGGQVAGVRRHVSFSSRLVVFLSKIKWN